ncbi:MAG: hypothetical protein MRJ92_10995 [Nitrospira sp.]|nr:hypothetical protein [Nitrospira sp.]
MLYLPVEASESARSDDYPFAELIAPTHIITPKAASSALSIRDLQSDKNDGKASKLGNRFFPLLQTQKPDRRPVYGWQNVPLRDLPSHGQLHHA